MGNKINRIQDEEDSIKVYLELNQTKLQLNKNLEGKVIFKVPPQIQGQFDLNLKIYGLENAEYNFKEKNKSIYQYSVKNHEFFEKTLSLVYNERIQVDEYLFVPFDWNPEISIPSLDYKYSADLIVSREYILEAILIVKNQRNKKFQQKWQQKVLFYKDSDEQLQIMKDSEKKQNQKVDAITTYKWFRQQKGLVFVSFEADKSIIFNGDYLNVTADVDNTFGYLKIQSAKILFYLEFIIKEEFLQGMPKVLLCEEMLVVTDQNKYFGKMNFQITDKLNLPYESVSERVGCRYIVVLQLIFEQLCLGSGVDNVEFILPYMDYCRDNKDNAEPQLECYTEIKNIDSLNKFMSPNYQLLSGRQQIRNQNTDFLTNRETRVAQQSQILIWKN
ncbi:unnamed protein product (macronuclear) [Paramecium tetraurelia]|uniref:Arrestin-like N-terminal domain-containing protein n=1 Tax=Paramecium tetraurelia TaxID=5888 RepID=A0BV52_PARTE|nr:uncharacterized protein GSPATT00005665001 [Paramecium tetraurelia]CAK62419.1 unnamed protein product [Paramecium tetraurelia]|eukprot:XP_001429817.1 hypothetical protein (macronuclear) [Paramecium tetraurelia strain d4-2]